MADTSTLSPPATGAPGLINSASGMSTSTTGATTGTSTADSGTAVTGYTPATSTATKADAKDFTVGANQTVAGQLDQILSSGSPLLDRARANAAQQMNNRGLINSSQAITAGEAGLIDKALPIATSDAGTYNSAMTNTTQAQNTKELQNSQVETQNSQFNAGQSNAALSLAAGASNQMALTELQGQNQQALQKLVGSQQLAAIDAQGNFQTKLQSMSDQNKLLLQTSSGAATYYQTMLGYMNSITTNPNMTHDQKAHALDNAVTALNDSLDTMTNIAGIPGVQSTLNFTSDDLGGASQTTTVSEGGGSVNVPIPATG